MATATNECRPCEDGFWFSIPTSALTLAGFREWITSPEFPEHVRASFINGRVYLDMSNEDYDTHVAVKTELTAVLAPIVRMDNLGMFYTDGGLVTNDAAHVSNNPDAVFISNDTLDLGRARFIPRATGRGHRELVGTPDWVLEIISDSSVHKDTEQLRRAYHAAGIREYWLVDARGEEIVFTILYWRKRGYVAAAIKDGWQRSRVFGRDFQLTRQQNDFGLWVYTLRMRSA